MKKNLISILLLVIITVPAFASDPGSIAGDIYYTDILTFLKGAPITSYNIGGKTVIDSEILNWHYGFDVYWHEQKRHLEIMDKGSSFTSLQAQAGETLISAVEKCGDIAGRYFHTDIVTTLNGQEIESYNLGGRTVIVAENMKDYGYDVLWSEEARTLNISMKANFYSLQTDFGTITTTQNGETVWSSCLIHEGSVNINTKPLHVPGGKYLTTLWRNTAFVPLKATLDAIGATYHWNNEDKILEVFYFTAAPPPTISQDGLQEEKIIQNLSCFSFDFSLIVNGVLYENLTGAHTISHTLAPPKRRHVSPFIYDGEIYITSNTVADFMGLTCEDGLNLFDPI